jgi:hypothetical protein
MSITRLENLLNSAPDAGLDSLVQQARRMGELTRVLRTALDPDLASSLKSANLRDGGVLVLICESSNWAARLRFEAESLMDVARSNGATVHTCRVTVSRSN